MTTATRFLHSASSRRSVPEVASLLSDAVSRHGFRTLGSFDLRQRMNEEKVSFEHECRVFHVCDPRQAKEVLERDITISAVMPCRIAVYEEEGKTVLTAVKPLALLSIFGHPDLEAVAQEVERKMIAIIDEAAAA